MSDQEVFTTEPPRSQPSGFVRFWAGAGRAVLRVVAGNFQKTRPSDAESAALSFSATPITEPVGQSYAVWRRSALWIAAVALFVHAIVLFSTFRFAETRVRETARNTSKKEVELIRKVYRKNPATAEGAARVNQAARRELWKMRNERSYQKQMEEEFVKRAGSSNLQLLDTVTLISYSIVAISCVLVLLSAVFWTNIRLSRLLSRIGWGIMFATPVLLGLLPLSKLMDFSHLSDAERKGVVIGLGLFFAFDVFVKEGSKIIAIFPGIIRSSMGLKTLLPESATPGWIVALITPIYTLMLLLTMITVNQLQGNWLLFFAALCLMTAPLIYLIFAKAIVRPHEAKEIGSVITPIRLAIGILTTVGLVLLSIWVLDLPMVSFGDVFKFIFGLIANVLLLTVVVTDIVIQTMRLGYIQSRGFHQSRMRQMLDRRFAALAQLGRSQTESESDVAPPPMPGEVHSEPVRINDDSLVVETACIETSRN